MLVISYQNNATPVSDFAALATAKKTYDESLEFAETYYPTSSSIFIESFRVLYALKLIDRTKIKFQYKDKTITILEDGSWSEYVKGFSIDWVDDFFGVIFDFRKEFEKTKAV